MTEIYFVRHAESDMKVKNDRTRPLTGKGMDDRALVTRYLGDKGIDVVLSSPYQRAVDTVKHFADEQGLPVQTQEGFAERRTASVWIEDFDEYARRQWADFSYKREGGESLGEVQARGIMALKGVLRMFEGKRVVIGTHGTALSTILHYYDEDFGHESFRAIMGLMPWVAHCSFIWETFVGWESVDVFSK